MRHIPKRMLAWLLMLAMLIALVPTFAFAAKDDVWAQIEAYEQAHLRKTRGANDELTAADYAALSGAIAEIVTSSNDYRTGTCTFDGTNAMFFWEDANGEPQGYSPSLRARVSKGATGVTADEAAVEETISYAKKGGAPDGKNVYVIGPWYGMDSSFTTQYQTEGQSIAASTGGTYTLYSGSRATVTTVANAMQDGAVVIFDSHGSTDYDQYMGYRYPDGGYDDYVYDSVTGAHTSYLTLCTGTGLTTADKRAVTGDDGKTYYHAYSFTSYGTTYYCVDGTAIANHMTKDAPNSMLWMAICLGMATDGIFKPMREKGVETVYGYSQSVTFTGDYQYEALFWSEMKAGKTVAEAAATMKKQTYDWDPAYAESSYYNTLAKARKYFVAFPVVVSSEDTYPGQRTDNTSNFGADCVQTVQSTWTLQASDCEHSYVYSLTTPPTLTEVGIITGVCSKCGRTVRVEMPALNKTDYTYTVLIEPTCAKEGVCRYNWRVAPYGDFTFDESIPKTNNHTWDDGVVTTEPTCTEAGVKTYTCTVCKTTKTEEIAATGHVWDDGKVTTEPTCTEAGVKTYTCTKCSATKTETVAALGHVDADKDNLCDRCGEKLGEDPTPTEDVCKPFTDIDQNAWYHAGVHYMIENGMMNGVGNGMFEPNGTVTRAMLVTILYRQAGSPSVEGQTNPFKDVPAGKYYTDPVTWAYQNGIVNGVSPTEFEPESNVTREQIATILYRQVGSPAVPETDLSSFLDVSDISSYAADAVRWAVSEGVIKGSKIGTVADVYATVMDELSSGDATGFEDVDGDGLKEMIVQVSVDGTRYLMLFDICGDELKCVSIAQADGISAFYSLSYTGVLYCTLLNYDEGFEIYRLDRASDDSYQPTLVASYVSYGAYCEEEYQQAIASLGLYRENNIELYYNNSIPYELRQAELIALFPQDTATRAEISTMLMRYLTK